MKIVTMLFLVCACIGPVFGQGMKPSAMATTEELKQLERDWSDAQKAGDVDKLNQILAADWEGLEFDGSKITKAQFLNDTKAGTAKLESFDIGPMDVKVMGNIAVVQGSDTEKSSMKGKDTSGKWVWMDVFEKRDGRWQAVRSQASRVE